MQNDLQLRQLGFAPIAWEKQKKIAARAHFAFNGFYDDEHQLELFQ